MTFEFDLITSIAVTLLLLIAGSWAAGNLRIFSRFSIPGPVIGGFAFALLVLILRQTGVAEIKVDTSLQSLAMLAFFTTIGLGASLGLVKKGGKILIIYLVACWTVAIFQNLIGIGLAKLLGIAPMLGIMAGAVSLEGGHGAAAAFGVTAAEMGYENASTVAIAAATFGLIAGSLTGGPLATWLINRNKLKIETKDIDLGSVDQKKHEELDAGEVIIAGGIIAVVVVAGVALGEWFAAGTMPLSSHVPPDPGFSSRAAAAWSWSEAFGRRGGACLCAQASDHVPVVGSWSRPLGLHRHRRFSTSADCLPRGDIESWDEHPTRSERLLDLDVEAGHPVLRRCEHHCPASVADSNLKTRLHSRPWFVGERRMLHPQTSADDFTVQVEAARRTCGFGSLAQPDDAAHHQRNDHNEDESADPEDRKLAQQPQKPWSFGS